MADLHEAERRITELEQELAIVRRQLEQFQGGQITRSWNVDVLLCSYIARNKNVCIRMTSRLAIRSDEVKAPAGVDRILSTDKLL